MWALPQRQTGVEGAAKSEATDGRVDLLSPLLAWHGELEASMAEGKAKAPALTTRNVVKAVEGVDWWRLGSFLNVPRSKRNEIEQSYPSEEEHREQVVQYWLEKDPTPSWRRVIWSLDRLEEYEAAERIRQYSEPLTDPTLTSPRVTTVLHTVPTKRWFEDGGLCTGLNIPQAKREEIKKQSMTEEEERTACVDYWLGKVPGASWQRLAGGLYSMEKEEAALEEARKCFQRQKDPTLTLDSLHAAARGVRSWEDLGIWIDVPESKLEEIRRQYTDNDQRLRALLEVWLKTHPALSWNLLAEAFYQTQEYDLLQRVREQYITASEESRRLFQEAMQHGFVEAAATKVLITGIAGSGKTCSKEVILGRKPPVVRRSTPCAERPVRVLRVDPQSSEWSTVGSERVKTFLAQIIKARALGLIQTPRATLLLTPEEKQGEPQHKQPTPSLQKEPASSKGFKWGLKWQRTTKESKTPSKATPTATIESTSATLEAKLQPSGTEEELVKLIDQCLVSDSVVSLQWIHFIDSGGQPQFQEVLPVFLRGTSVCFFVFKLSEELQDHPLVEYYDENGELIGKRYRADHTNEEILKQCITTMQSHKSQSAYKAPKVIILGTHKDKEWQCKETREAKNKKLLKMLLPDLRDEVTYYDESCQEVIIPLNARFPGPEEEKIADQIRRLIMSKCSPKPEKIPLRWYALEMLLRELAEALGSQVLDKKKCFAKARSLHFDEKSFEAALKYLDSLNLIFYYDEVLPEVIICDIQVPLDKVTELVKLMFRFRKNPARGVITNVEMQKFLNHGVVTAEFLSEPQFEEHYVPGLFTAQELIKLFRTLLIFADLSNSEYFMPCLLETLKSAEVESHRVSHDAAAAPLVLHHSHGPRSGLFCSLISFLLSGDNHFPCPWQLVSKLTTPECLFRNCVEFAVPKHPGTITLIDSFRYFEVHIYLPPRMAAKICPKFCPIVSDAVLAGLTKASSTLGYDNSKPVKAFFCPCGDGDPHPATLGEDQSYWVCTRNPRECDEIESNQLVWLPPKRESKAIALVPANTVEVCDVLTECGFSPADWEDLAVRLSKDIDVKCIRLDELTSNRCLRETIRQWLRKDTEASWSKVANAVAKISDYGDAVAEKILSRTRTGSSHGL